MKMFFFASCFFGKKKRTLTKKGTHPAPPPNTTQERQERKRKAKGERAGKGDTLLKQGGECECKICAKVRALAQMRIF
jgi:hypothetical protein